MTLIKWKNNSNVADSSSFIPSTFTDFFNDFLGEDLLQKNFFKTVPAVSILERKDDFMIQLASPGIQKDDFKIEVDKGVLTIRVEKKDEKKEENDRYTRREFAFTSFSRTFSLPDDVNSDKIAAEYKDGMLMLSIPKKEETKSKPVRQITIS